MSSARHGKDEETVEELRAQRDQLAAALTAALAQLDRIGASAGFAVASDGTGPLPAVPAQRARSRHAARGTHLRLVKLFIPGAVLGALKYAWHAHRAATVAAGVLTVGAVTTAAVVPGAAPLHGFLGAAPASSAPASGLYSATPISSSSPLRLIGSVSRPGLDAKTATGNLPGGLPPELPSCCYYQPPPSSQASAQQQPQPSASSAPAGHATLSVPVSGIDLSSGTPQTIVLTATGTSGWVSWRVDTRDPLTGAAQADLDFSATHGVLPAGGNVTLTVSVDPAQAQDGNTQETFTINGESVTATLPAPPPAPSPAVTPTDMPTDLPSALPS